MIAGVQRWRRINGACWLTFGRRGNQTNPSGLGWFIWYFSICRVSESESRSRYLARQHFSPILLTLQFQPQFLLQVFFVTFWHKKQVSLRASNKSKQDVMERVDWVQPLCSAFGLMQHPTLWHETIWGAEPPSSCLCLGHDDDPGRWRIARLTAAVSTSSGAEIILFLILNEWMNEWRSSWGDRIWLLDSIFL